jgi:hypothetical protein
VNNNTDLARVMRAWLASRDEEEREKKENGNDARALDVRRRRLHELETERLGLTDVCRYETRVVTEDEEIGPQGIETNERQSADSDNSDPIAIDDEPNQTELDPLEDLEPPTPIEQPDGADQIAPIVELLRKRQREEREEADTTREEQVLLNKRLAMMEEQVQMLTKLITQRNPPPTPPSPTVNVLEHYSAEVAVEPDMEAETMATSEPVHDIIVVPGVPAEHALEERAGAPLELETTAKSTGTGTDTHAVDEVADVASDDRLDMSLEPGPSKGPEDAGIGGRVLDEAAETPADVPMGDSAETPGSPSAGLGTTTSVGTTGSQNDDAQATSVAANSPAANAQKAIDARTVTMDEDPAMGTSGTTDTTND